MAETWPNSLSQDVGLGLGAAAGADKLNWVFTDASEGVTLGPLTRAG